MTMHRTVWLALVVSALPLTARCADPARSALRDGIRLYEDGSFDKSATRFDEAAQGASRAKLDAAVPKYNQGNALIRAGQPDEASKAYADALRSTDLSLQGKAYFNRGNALARISGEDEAKGELDAASRALDEALVMYENAMALDPQDEDAKVNYELALKQKEQLQQKQQQQQQQQEQDQEDQQKEDEQSQPQQQQGQDQQEQNQQNEQQEQQEQQGQQPQEQEASQEQAQSPKSSEAMTPEEAAMVLDSMKQEEQAKREQLKLIIGQPVPVDKDW
jgi:Ca-activated chloride channel homolog